MVQQVRSDYTNALDRVWDKVDSLEAAHNALASRVGEEEQDLEGAEQGTEGAAHPALQVRVRALEEDSKSVHEHTAKLDRYIETMLRDMLGTLNQGEHTALAPHHLNITWSCNYIYQPFLWQLVQTCIWSCTCPYDILLTASSTVHFMYV